MNESSNEIWHQAGLHLQQQKANRDQLQALKRAALPPLPDGLSPKAMVALALERSAAVVDDDLPNIPEGADSVALIRLGTDRTSAPPPPLPPAPAAEALAPGPAAAAPAGAPAMPPTVAAVLASIQGAMASPGASSTSDAAAIRRLFRELPGSDRDRIFSIIERQSYGVANYLRDPATRDHAAVLVGDALLQRLEDGRRLQPDLTPADVLAQLAAAADITT